MDSKVSRRLSDRGASLVMRAVRAGGAGVGSGLRGGTFMAASPSVFIFCLSQEFGTTIDGRYRAARVRSNAQIRRAIVSARL